MILSSNNGIESKFIQLIEKWVKIELKDLARDEKIQYKFSISNLDISKIGYK